MTTTDDPEEFERRWKSHINELEKLKPSTEDFDDFARIDEIKEELDEIVERVARNINDEQT